MVESLSSRLITVFHARFLVYLVGAPSLRATRKSALGGGPSAGAMQALLAEKKDLKLLFEGAAASVPADSGAAAWTSGVRP